jgi:hypothetical protein
MERMGFAPTTRLQSVDTAWLDLHFTGTAVFEHAGSRPLPRLAGSPHNMPPRLPATTASNANQVTAGMASTAFTSSQSHPRGVRSFFEKLNGPLHKRTLRAFMIIVIVHLAEHLVQAYQVYVLGWPLHQARGVLGQAFPWLVHSEVLHYGYALIMLVGIWTLLPGFVGRSRRWWLAALVIQFWHHVEHLLLQGQAIAGRSLFGAPVPTSIAQLWIPRLELHLLYNSLVFVPMMVAMYYHLFPSAPEAAGMRCSCSLRSHPATA